jgi:hypothetical protein
MNMKFEFNFSDINLQYLLRARDLAMQDSEVVATLLGLSVELAHTLTQTTPQELTQLTRIKTPLVVPRQDAWWWARLLNAIRDGQPGEIDAIVEHAALITAAQPGGDT